MAYVEKRGRHLTGMWYGECKHHKLGRLRRRFKTKDLAEAYEAHVRAHGEEPQLAVDGQHVEGVKTFEDVYRELKAAGGPGGVWTHGRDPKVMERLEFVCRLCGLGSTAIDAVTYTLAERIVANLRTRPGKAKGSRLSNATINRYLSGLSAVLTVGRRRATRSGLSEAASAVPQRARPCRAARGHSRAVPRYRCHPTRAGQAHSRDVRALA